MTNFERLQKKVKELLPILSPFEQEIIKMRFGLDGEASKPLEEVERKFGISRQELRDIEAKLLERM